MRLIFLTPSLIGSINDRMFILTNQQVFLIGLITFLHSYYRLVGDVLLATGFLSYSGPFNQEFRAKLQKDWQKEMKTRRIPFTAGLNLIEMLVDNPTVSFVC